MLWNIDSEMNFVIKTITNEQLQAFFSQHISELHSLHKVQWEIISVSPYIWYPKLLTGVLHHQHDN
jgi:hypothetical protein